MDAIVEINSEVIINAQNFTAANNGTFEVTGIGTNYFEVTNASGVAESNKTIGTGSIKYSINIQANRTHTVYEDTVNTTGYGWFVFYNSNTKKVTSNSNAIPYGGFAENSVKDIFDAFFSQLNNKEMKMISNEDSFRWLNEGYAKIQNQLNLVNQNYKVTDEWSFTTISGTQEYALPDNFSDLRSITNSSGDELVLIDLRNVPENDNDGSYSISTARYYIRGKYIGISSIPTGTDTYYVYYKTKSSVLTSYYDNIDLPDNNFYPIVDFMMYRAAPKLNRTDAKVFLDAFNLAVNDMKVISHKQDENRDSWGISSTSNV